MRKPYISPQLAHAIDLLLFEEYRKDDAARTAGIQPQTLEKALRKKHVRDYRRERWSQYLHAEAEKSVIKIVQLRDKAASEHVQRDCAMYLAQASEELQKMRGDSSQSGAHVSVTLALQGIQAQQLPQGWKPPQGASVPEHLIQDQQSNGGKVLEHKDDGGASDGE
jgi:hypothetical protein